MCLGGIGGGAGGRRETARANRVPMPLLASEIGRMVVISPGPLLSRLGLINAILDLATGRTGGTTCFGMLCGTEFTAPTWAECVNCGILDEYVPPTGALGGGGGVRGPLILGFLREFMSEPRCDPAELDAAPGDLPQEPDRSMPGMLSGGLARARGMRGPLDT